MFSYKPAIWVNKVSRRTLQTIYRVMWVLFPAEASGSSRVMKQDAERANMKSSTNKITQSSSHYISKAPLMEDVVNSFKTTIYCLASSITLNWSQFLLGGSYSFSSAKVPASGKPRFWLPGKRNPEKWWTKRSTCSIPTDVQSDPGPILVFFILKSCFYMTTSSQMRSLTGYISSMSQEQTPKSSMGWFVGRGFARA